MVIFISGGEITGNIAGVEIGTSDELSLVITGGKIHNNISSNYGVGIFITDTAIDFSFKIGGTAVIENNGTPSKPNNIEYDNWEYYPAFTQFELISDFAGKVYVTDYDVDYPIGYNPNKYKGVENIFTDDGLYMGEQSGDYIVLKEIPVPTGQCISLKTPAGWVKGIVRIKTPNGWKEAKVVRVKTANGWKPAKQSG